MSVYNIIIDEIGDIKLKFSKLAKHIILSIDSNNDTNAKSKSYRIKNNYLLG